MARADHVRAGLTIRCAVYTRAPRRSRCGLAPRRAHAAWIFTLGITREPRKECAFQQAMSRRWCSTG